MLQKFSPRLCRQRNENFVHFLVCELERILRAPLHQASASTLRQLCDDACDSVLIEINEDT